MKRLAALFFAVLLLPALALAADIRTGHDSLTISKSQAVGDDLYVFAGNVRIDGHIHGDLFIAAGNVTVTGPIDGDVTVAGGQINISGPVGDDIRVAGGDVTVSGEVGGDILAASGSLTLTAESRVRGQLRLAAGSVTLAGVSGSVIGSVGSLELQKGAVVNGELSYESRETAKIDAASQVTGKVTHRVPADRGNGRGWLIWSALALYLIVVLSSWLLPVKSAALGAELRTKFWWSLLTGFLWLIALPIAVLLLFITVVGIPLALLGLGLYFAILFLGLVPASLALGQWLLGLVNRGSKETPSLWLTGAVGVLVLTLLGLIPVLGPIVTFLLLLAGAGALLRFDWRLLQKLRADKTL